MDVIILMGDFPLYGFSDSQPFFLFMYTSLSVCLIRSFTVHLTFCGNSFPISFHCHCTTVYISQAKNNITNLNMMSWQISSKRIVLD